MHNTYLKGQLIWAIESLFSHCTVSRKMRCRHTVQVHNSLRELCYFNYSTFTFVGFAEALSRSSNGIVQTTTAPQIHHHSPCGALVER